MQKELAHKLLMSVMKCANAPRQIDAAKVKYPLPLSGEVGGCEAKT